MNDPLLQCPMLIRFEDNLIIGQNLKLFHNAYSRIIGNIYPCSPSSQSDVCGRKTFVPLILGLSHPFTIDTRVPKPLYSVELRLFHDLEQSFPLYNFYNVMPEITSNIYCKQV